MKQKNYLYFSYILFDFIFLIVSQKLVFLYIYIQSTRSISDIVYLLPLLFSLLANLGQLYATSHFHMKKLLGCFCLHGKDAHGMKELMLLGFMLHGFLDAHTL